MFHQIFLMKNTKNFNSLKEVQLKISNIRDILDLDNRAEMNILKI